MRVTRTMCRSAATSDELSFLARPLQIGMGGCPWRAAIASMLLCRTRRAQAQPALQELLKLWPTAAELARSGEELEEVVRPCGLHRNRARQMRRFSNQYLGDSWVLLRELTGVGRYVHDAVGLCVFGLTDIESDDEVLRRYACSLLARSLSS
jgi:endonuclease III